MAKVNDPIRLEESVEKLKSWLAERKLCKYLHEVGTADGSIRFQYVNRKRPVRPGGRWASGFHGTWFYGLCALLNYGLRS